MPSRPRIFSLRLFSLRPSLPIGAAALASLLLLAGCGDSGDKFAPPCPSLALLRDAADLVRFNGRGQDITDTEVTARLVAVPAACHTTKPGTVAATIQPTMSFTRGPALGGRTVTVPYMVTVTEGTQILDQKRYALQGSFPANVDQVTLQVAPIELLFPVTRAKTAAAYSIYVSFVLSDAELAYNRGRRGQ